MILFLAAAIAAQPLLTIEGTGPAPVAITREALRSLPRESATRDVHGKTLTCEGVRLSALLVAQGLPTGNAVRGPALATTVVAEARDGYRVAFSWGELAPGLGNGSVIVADRCNGKDLTAEDGPVRLLVPGEARAARSVRQLERLKVVR
jgi:hypothetical protein